MPPVRFLTSLAQALSTMSLYAPGPPARVVCALGWRGLLCDTCRTEAGDLTKCPRLEQDPGADLHAPRALRREHLPEGGRAEEIVRLIEVGAIEKVERLETERQRSRSRLRCARLIRAGKCSNSLPANSTRFS